MALRWACVWLAMMVMMLGTKAMDAGDQSALTAFYNGLDDKGTLGWNTGTDLCGQTGIICSGDRAQRLNLFSKGLQGTIATELGSLSNLTFLLLDGNNLHGAIPTQFANLVSIQLFSLGTNQLSGSIPTYFSTFSGLEFIGLASNKLSGTIPPQIFSAPSLSAIDFQNNSLTGIIPTQIAQMVLADEVYLSRNQLTGTIPTQISLLQSLTILQLDNNFLTGTVPSSIASLPLLDKLLLTRNYLYCPVLDYSNVPTNDYSATYTDCNYSCGHTPQQYPCKNNGICYSKPNFEFGCSCVEGTFGTECENKSNSSKLTVSFLFLFVSCLLLIFNF